MNAINQNEVLDTPSDLKEKGREKVAESVNRLVADSFALYIKTKNYHWHMSGRHFRDYHLLLDEQAEQIFATIDPLAERVRKLGANTIRSVAHIAQLQRVKDNDEDFVAPKDMLLDLVEENKKMAKNMRDTHQICDDAEDVATASLLENYIDETERRVWFLFETTRELN
ncbi:Dps family protein [Spirosoma agri]|jgi:starvation-inducible DNA-binding protein|uniref:DNA starvation/stationary phase protection protein n=1 Tax=Spirosoma agri TaxID=1987381 RepID=A0A6M0IK71_9BACT|nr:DNA starvation/stationary phase protection protein [Spirosoma agri]NEU68700.1 DNA starvation/stationary phase protection protein [Spirosoma agri]